MAGVKRSRDESAYRAKLSTAINSFAPVTRACFNYSANGRVYRISPRSSRYGEVSRIRSKKKATYRNFQKASEALERLQSRLRASSSKLVRLRKQQKLLENRSFSILNRELSSEDVVALEIKNQKLLEQLAARKPSNPKNSEGPSASKRPRHESAKSADSISEPIASTRSPHSPKPVNSRLALNPAVLKGFPSFLFGDGLVSAEGQGSGDRTL
ncbi:hypothetical protein B0J12DRAFT_691639 [Macrophomina phaseolina]|uniref:Uncharacterized protein n=1 Tax=Macrophomina phaseolina TaxID=35725 RepID=A0ABQ8FR18_9PEZI|nr:hypothetical protein B0J12DRAFT_691639 [Macrophomina phaseolina]